MGLANFGSAVKGANNSWGTCTSDDFLGPCYIGPENFLDNRAQRLMISGTALKEPYFFTREDIAQVQVLAVTFLWIKFLFRFRDGKSVIATINAVTQNGQGGYVPSIGLLNLEGWIGEKLYL